MESAKASSLSSTERMARHSFCLFLLWLRCSLGAPLLRAFFSSLLFSLASFSLHLLLELDLARSFNVCSELYSGQLQLQSDYESTARLRKLWRFPSAPTGESSNNPRVGL